MAQNKTRQTKVSVDKFITSIEPEDRQADCAQVVDLMGKVTGCDPAMWGNGMIGFDTYHYKYESGREGDWFITGVSPRKAALTLYIMAGFSEYDDLMAKLGKYKTGRSCLYLKKLSDVDLKVLEKLIRASVKYMRKTYPAQ